MSRWTGLADACALGAGLAAQAGWEIVAAISGLGVPGGRGIPNDASEITAAWLTDALADSFPGVHCTCVERLGGHTGTTARHRLRIDASAGAPKTIFVKQTPAEPVSRLFTSVFDLGAREVRFYRDVRGDLPVPAPRCFAARASTRGGRFVLVLEDLEAAGARLPTFDEEFSEERLGAVVETLARLHAHHWTSQRFRGDLAWLPYGARGRDHRRGRFVSARSHGPAMRRFGALVPEEIRGDLHLVHEHRDLLEEAWIDAPETLIHGDAHAGNLYFDREGRPGLLDWQVVQRGDGMRDVSYFLIQTLEPEERRARERALIDRYRAALGAAGVAAPSPEEAFERHRLHAFYVWIAVSVTAAAATLQSRAVVERAVGRAGAALRDLDSLGALRRLAGGPA